MKVVCNSSTLIALARIGHLDILEKEVKSLLIPRAVYEEVVVKGMDKPGAVEIREAKWIEERDVHNRELVMGFNTVLDLGESEAIVLAKEINADLLILDDEEARKKALSEGIRVAGLLAILIQAKKRGTIKKVKPFLEALKDNGFFIREELYYQTIQEAEE